LLLICAVREAGVAEPGRFVATILLPLVWCTTAVGLVGQVLPGLDFRSTVMAFALYLLLLTPLVPGWTKELQRIRH